MRGGQVPISVIVAWSVAGAAGGTGDLYAQQPVAAAAAACEAGAVAGQGVVRRLHGGTVAGVTVTVGWNVLMLQGLAVRVERCERRTTTGDDGTFAVAGLPANESLLTVASGPDGEVGVVLRHSAGDFAQQPLVVFLPSTADVIAAGPPGNAAACRSRGRVVTASGAPVANARVAVAGRDVVRTDRQGAFDAPSCGVNGTTFEVRGLNVAKGEWWVGTAQPPAYWVVALDRPLPRLDAVTVTAPRREYVDVTGFEQRRRGPWGRFVARSDILQRNPVRIHHMFEGMPGIQVYPTGQIIMTRTRGIPCSPNVFVDGQLMLGFGEMEMIDPQTVYGLEVYRRQFQPPAQGMQGACGAVVVWTRSGLGQIGSSR